MSADVAREGQRTALAERRRLALDAFIDLALEGGLPPTSEDVARRAGISLATLFRYFETLDELRREAAIRMVQRFPRLFLVRDIGVGPRDERIGRFAAIRVELWETIHPLALLLRSNAHHDPGAADLLAFARASMADQVGRHFADELGELKPAQRDDAVATIASLTSVESWDQFRHAHGRSPAQTRRAWARAIERVLDDR